MGYGFDWTFDATRVAGIALGAALGVGGFVLWVVGFLGLLGGLLGLGALFAGGLVAGMGSSEPIDGFVNALLMVVLVVAGEVVVLFVEALLGGAGTVGALVNAAAGGLVLALVGSLVLLTPVVALGAVGGRIRKVAGR